MAVAALCLASAVSAMAEEKKEIQWSDVSKEIKEVKIKSSLDGTMQPSMFYKAKQPNRPVLVCLHAWSANYKHVYAGRLEYCIAHDINFINPHFRGPNNTPEAMGSDLTVADIQDAIECALREGKADPKEVHLIGASGGGTMVMNCYMRLRYPVKSFTAIVGIYDIERWYYAVQPRGYKQYCRMIEGVCQTKEGEINAEEVHRRSPFYYDYPTDLRRGSTLLMLDGIHDGYTADVPITQTLRMWNKLAAAKYPLNTDLLVSDYEMAELLSMRCAPWREVEYIGKSQIYCHRKYGDMELYLYEAGHGGPYGINDCELIPIGK